MVKNLKFKLDSKIKTPILQKISTLIVLYLAISSILPQIKVLPGYQISVFLAVGIWVLIALLMRPAFFINLKLEVFIIILFVFYTVLFPYLFGNGIIGNRYLDFGVSLFFYIIFIYNETYNFTNSSRTIVFWTIPFLLYTSLITLVGLLDNPYLARSIKTKGDYSTSLRIDGVGGYELVYFLVFISIILFYLILNGKIYGIKKVPRFMLFLLLTIFTVTIILSNYLTALVMLFMSFLIILITKSKNLLFKFIVTFTGIVILIFIEKIILYIFNLLIDILGSGSIVYKLNILKANIMGTSNVSITSDRFTRLSLDIEAFKENPLFGIIVKPIQSNGDFLVGFGQHSQFLDTLALFGLFIGLLNLFIVLSPFFIRLKTSTNIKGLSIAMLFSVIIIFSMNNITHSIGFAIFFVYPVVYSFLIKDRKRTMELQNN